MGRVAKVALRERWRSLVESYQSSEESLKEYCLRHGVSTASFYAWRRRLRPDAVRKRKARVTSTADGKGNRPNGHESDTRASEPSAFVPVHAVLSAEQSVRSIRIHLADCVSIEIPVEQKELLFELVAHLGQLRSVS